MISLNIPCKSHFYIAIFALEKFTSQFILDLCLPSYFNIPCLPNSCLYTVCCCTRPPLDLEFKFFYFSICKYYLYCIYNVILLFLSNSFVAVFNVSSSSFLFANIIFTAFTTCTITQVCSISISLSTSVGWH